MLVPGDPLQLKLILVSTAGAYKTYRANALYKRCSLLLKETVTFFVML
jgi:hypothetical protein